MLSRKFVWLIMLMVWVGMVTSIIVYQGEDYLAKENLTSTSGNVKIINELKVEVAGYDVVIVEESMDSGNTIQVIIDHVKEKGLLF